LIPATPSRLDIAEDLTEDRFDALRFVVSERSEFLGAGALRQASVVLLQEAEKQVRHAFGRVDEGVDLPPERVVPAQESGFVGQVLLETLTSGHTH
jgi:hypothetical protein